MVRSSRSPSRSSAATSRPGGQGRPTLDVGIGPRILDRPCHTRASSSLAAPSAELLSSVVGFRAWEDVPSNAAYSSRAAPPGNGEGPFSYEAALTCLGSGSLAASLARAARGLPPLTTVAAMFAFSSDRHASHLQSHGTDGTRRFVRNGVAPPGAQPASLPHVAPHLPATVPAEPDHERAYPQADGEP
jgi:hypothetical protein